MLAVCFILVHGIALLLASEDARSEDPNSGTISMTAPTHYVNGWHMRNIPRATNGSIDVEKVNETKIKFILSTSNREHYCELSGQAETNGANKRVYIYRGHGCMLLLLLSNDGSEITATDPDGRCKKICCGFNGIIDGFVFTKLLGNSIAYEYEDPSGNLFGTIDIERKSATRIKFGLGTLIDKFHLCDMSGEAFSASAKGRDYVYHGRGECLLNIRISDDGNTVTVTDPAAGCQPYFCGPKGYIDGFIFKKKK